MGLYIKYAISLITLKMNKAFRTTQSTLDILSPHLTLHHFNVGDLNFSSLYQQVLINRQTYYLKHAPHLMSESEMSREIEVDQRSMIFSVSAKNRVIGSLRLTSHPYELEDHDRHNIEFKKFNNFLEIGRLVTDPELGQVNLALLVRYLLCGAGLIAFDKMKASGFVAICRPYRLPLFSKFGLTHHFDIFSQQRKIQYCFMSGTAADILSTTAELQSNENNFRKRLERLGRKA